ncbi:NADH:ubiquinone oxidoreductase subunit M [Paenibacillus swuensis]|uniref:NADH:ubiquinone oxidoreductase subunit M n=1 Tax=Paenibacillus swuensis TaxID=1178515 RepID=A0A172TII6_9BACL|nr:NADH-quinone oxidoreductase subunit M [Paenibacillus swuensis]ANE46677.1 NADH:ubiquinone oxidoreductase subunit M [Paenibacillus swuensis]
MLNQAWPLLSLITFSPLIGILLIAFLSQTKGKWIRIIAVSAAALPLLGSAWLYGHFSHIAEGPQFMESYAFLQIPLSQESEMLSQYTSYFYQFNYTMAVDGLSLPLVFLTSLIAFMAVMASLTIRKRLKSFYILFLLLEIGMLGVFMARDLILFFLFFEITLVAMFFLVGIWGYVHREKAANQFLIYNGIGSAVMLLAFILLITTAGFTMNQVNDTTASISYSGDIGTIMEHLRDPQAPVNQDPGDQGAGAVPFFLSEGMRGMIFFLLLIAFGIKLPVFPFHTWMLKVHTEAPTSIVMIHSGILLKMGAYGLIRFGAGFFPDQAERWAWVIAGLGVINILYGAVLALVQNEFKLLLAYSSISHMGIVLLGIAAMNPVGLQGAVYQMISHGLISALLFLIVGSIYERTQTTELDRLGGLAANLPFISGILLFAGLASIGLPGLSGFIGELLSFIGLFKSMPVLTAVGTLGIILGAVYMLRGVLSITYGTSLFAERDLRDARFMEALPMVTLVAFILLLGIYPSLITEPMQQTFGPLLHAAAAKIGG